MADVLESLWNPGKSVPVRKDHPTRDARWLWAEKSREQLELLRNRPLDDADWLSVLIDGVWLTREICVVVAVGIDIAGYKRVLDFEQGTSENTTVVAALVERLATRGVKTAEGRRLLVQRDGSQAIASAVRRM